MSDNPVKKEKYNAKKTVKVNNQWWSEDDKSVYNHITPILNKIEEDQNYIQQEHLKYARLYSNKQLLGFSSNLYSRSSNDGIQSTTSIKLNIIKNCVDTVSSKIGKMKPRPLFLTEGGNWEQQQKGKKLSKYVQGVFEDQDAYTIGSKIFVDACVFGTGFIKIYSDGSRIRLERVIPIEIKVDDAESIYGKPRQLHQIRYINREVLAGMFPDSVKDINLAIGGIEGDNTSNSIDMIKVTESWHLRSSNESTDGKHCITINNCTLFSEVYEKDFFPFVKFTWSDKLLGFFGMGLAEELIGIQLEINKMLLTIQKAQHLASVPRVYIEAASKVVTAHINNDIGSVVKYVGTPPTIQSSNAMPAEVYQHLQTLKQSAYEITGISQLSASAKKPAGLNSAVALREMSDIETERFQLTAMRYEKMFLDMAKIIVNLSKDLYESNKQLKVKVSSAKFIESIKWRDVDLDEDKFSLTLYPVSMLPSSPQGKLDKVQELIQAGFISKEDGMAMLDYPDLDSVMNLELAGRNIAMKILGKMVEDGEYITPEPYMNLALTLNIAQNFYLDAMLDGVPEDRLQLIRDFMEDVNSLLQPPEPELPPMDESIPMDAAMDPMMDEPIDPLAVPEAPPTSELLPNVPV